MALFPGFGGGAGKLGKSALGTRLNTTYLEIMIPSCPLTAWQICFARFFCRQVNGFSEALVDLASSSINLVLACMFCFSHYRARDGTSENRELFLSYRRLIHVHPRANVCKIKEKTKGKFPGQHHVVWIGKTKHTSQKGLLLYTVKSYSHARVARERRRDSDGGGKELFIFIFTTKRREWVCSSTYGAWEFNAVQITYTVQHHN